MFFWKIDEETIRCLIHKQEINGMGFDLESLGSDHEQMEEFLNAIVQSSRNYIDWHTENGIQNYIAKSLPADQLLVTISCTFPDVAIDRDLDQIRKMTSALNLKITEERLNQIHSLSGEEKEKAFEEMSRDLHNVCMGVDIDAAESPAAEVREDSGESGGNHEHTGELPQNLELPPRKLIFSQFSALLRFCSVLSAKLYLKSTLYKKKEEYVLFVDFSDCETEAQALAFMITAEEYGGSSGEVRYDEAYLKEHGRILIENDAIKVLNSMN